jgi:hypothetical protein
MPVILNASNYELCWALCNMTTGCAGWSYGDVAAGCETKPLCWLKSTPGAWVAKQCRTAGNMGKCKFLGYFGPCPFVLQRSDLSYCPRVQLALVGPL